MTVITAVSDGTRVCMACDSQLTNAYGAITSLARPKIVKLAGVLFAGEGSLSIDQFLNYRFSLRPVGPDAALTTFASQFADMLRDDLKQRDLMRKVDGSPELPGNILVARGPEFVLIDSGGSVIELELDWWAIGSGAAEARGAMFVAEQLEHAGADEVARAGVAAAIALDSGCGGTIHVLWTEP